MTETLGSCLNPSAVLLAFALWDQEITTTPITARAITTNTTPEGTLRPRGTRVDATFAIAAGSHLTVGNVWPREQQVSKVTTGNSSSTSTQTGRAQVLRPQIPEASLDPIALPQHQGLIFCPGSLLFGNEWLQMNLSFQL